MNKEFLYIGLISLLFCYCSEKKKEQVKDIEKQKLVVFRTLDSLFISNGAKGNYLLLENYEETKAKSMTARRFYENTKYHKGIGKLLLEKVEDSLNFLMKNYDTDKFTYALEPELIEQLEFGDHPEVAGLFEMSRIVSNGEKSAVYVATHTGESNFYIIVLKKENGTWIKDTVARIMSSKW